MICLYILALDKKILKNHNSLGQNYVKNHSSLGEKKRNHNGLGQKKIVKNHEGSQHGNTISVLLVNFVNSRFLFALHESNDK
jgi:hypothetical protein